MNALLVLPVMIPVATAAAGLAAHRAPRVQRALGLVGSAALLVVSLLLLAEVRVNGIQATQVGAWPAPFGITFVADLFSAIMVVLAGIIGLATTLYSFGSMDHRREAYGYYPLLQVLLMGVCGAFLTGDIFNLYVWFEVMLMSSFVLLALGGERQQLQGGILYVTLNLLSSAFFLAAVGILYGMVGTLNLADLAVKLRSIEHAGAITIVSLLFLIAFGIKAAVFPLFFWLPASYHTPPAAISAIFAGLLTKVGVYSLIRVFTLLFLQNTGFTHLLILVLSGLTMLTGVLGAAAQHEFRRILSFHIISQIGYMTLGLGLAGLAGSLELATLALAGSIFYVIHHIIVKTNLFLVSGAARRLAGSYELSELGGLYLRYPLLAFLFLIPALSLAGMPPLSGFFAKLSLIRASLELEHYAIAATALVVGLLTLFSMTKIWAEAFWKPLPEGRNWPAEPPRGLGWMLTASAALAALTVTIGLAGEPFFDLARQAASQLLDPREYIEAVRRGTP